MTLSRHTQKWWMLALAYLALIGGYIAYSGWTSSLSVIADDLSISYAQAGALSSMASFIAGVCMLLAGPACSRWGARNVVLVGLAAALIGQFLFASADTYSLALVSRLVSGMAVGLVWAGTYTVAVTWFQNYGKTDHAVGVMETGSFAGLLTTLYGFAFILTTFGWQTGLSIGGLIVGGILILSFFFLKNAPQSTIDSSPDATAQLDHSKSDVFRSMLNRNVLLTALFWVAAIGFFSLVASWMPTILVEEAGWSQSGAGLTSSLFSMAGGFAALGAGFLAPKLGRRRSLLVPASGILSALSIAGLGYCLVSGTFGLVYLFISLVGIGLIAGEVVSLASAVDSVPMKFAGVANGFVLGAGFIIGGVGYPFALGSIKDATGSYAAGFVAITVVTLLACGVAQAFRREPITSGQDGILDPTVNAVGDSPRQATTTI